MSNAIAELEARTRLRPFDIFFSLYIREMKRFLKVIFQTVFTPMINSTLYLLIFGVSLGSAIQLDHPISYLAFLIPGLVMMGVLNNAFQNSSSSIVSGKFSGDLEDLKVVPLTPQMIMWAMSIGGLTRGLIVGLITFLVGEVFIFIIEGQLITVAHPLWLLFFLVVGGLTFSKLGIAVAFFAKTFDQLSAVGAFVLLPLIYLGGVFFSLKGLHPFWQTVSSFNPVLYLINGVRYGLLGVTDVSISTAAIVSVVFLFVFHFVGLRSLKHGDYQRW
ncbi:MAG TPA: ABC transporter permease [Bdellovibrionales bacterium]|nr:ABC transporter permease [Bdellovibrionales bacterium]